MTSGPTSSAPLENATVWPGGARLGSLGVEIAGVPVTLLVAKYGTPLLVTDEEDLRSRARRFATAFERTFYGAKAFTSRFVIQTVHSESMGILVASGNEFDAALRAGVPPQDIIFHGNNKSEAEISSAIRHSVRALIIDNAAELEQVARISGALQTRQQVLLRVTPGVNPQTHAAIQTGGRGSKFGIPIDAGEAASAIRHAARLPALDLLGVHFHVGSQILTASSHLEAIAVVLDVVADVARLDGIQLSVLDIGGGFGVRYVDEDEPHVEAVATQIAEAAAIGTRARGVKPMTIWAEPGRAIVANSTITVYRVGSIKRVADSNPYVAVDGGMSDNIRPALYGARYTVRMVNARGGGDVSWTIVGKHCESGDVLARDVRLPSSLRSGDLLAFAATGAYTYSMASNYNRLGRPAVVAVRDGQHEIVLRRENADDLDRLEIVRPVGTCDLDP